MTFFFCLPPSDLAGLDDGGGALSFFGACKFTTPKSKLRERERNREDEYNRKIWKYIMAVKRRRSDVPSDSIGLVRERERERAAEVGRHRDE